MKKLYFTSMLALILSFGPAEQQYAQNMLGSDLKTVCDTIQQKGNEFTYKTLENGDISISYINEADEELWYYIFDPKKETCYIVILITNTEKILSIWDLIDQQMIKIQKNEYIKFGNHFNTRYIFEPVPESKNYYQIMMVAVPKTGSDK